jgi:hypothetical protein
MDLAGLIALWLVVSLCIGGFVGLGYYLVGLVLLHVGLRLGAGTGWPLTGAWVTAFAALATFAGALIAGEQTFARLPCLDGGETLPQMSVWLTEWAVWLIAAVIFVASTAVVAVRRQPYVLGMGLLLALGLAAGFEIGRAQAPTTCRNEAGPTDVHQPSALVFRFTAPWPGMAPTPGKSYCHRAYPMAQVDWIQTYSDPFNSVWLFGTPPTRQVRLAFDPTGDFLKVDLTDLAAHKPAVYGALLGGTTQVGSVERDGAADGSTGRIVFTDLAYVPDEAFDPTMWPETISGEISWSCQPVP